MSGRQGNRSSRRPGAFVQVGTLHADPAYEPDVVALEEELGTCGKP